MSKYCLALLLLPLLVSPAVGSDVGRRFPAEMTSYQDPVTGITVKVLTSSSASDSKPYQTHTTWTADGQWIIFRSNRAGDASQAFLVNETSGEIVQLTDDPDVDTGSLNLSRKEMKLFFLRGGRRPRRRGPDAEVAAQAGLEQPTRPLQLIELDLTKLLADSAAGAIQEPEVYERMVATMPTDVRVSGGLALDADETKIYFGWGPQRERDPNRPRQRRRRGGNRERSSSEELLERNSNVNEPREGARQRFSEAGKGPGGIRSIDVATGETATVVDVDFRMGHVQANPWVPGEILYCHETTGDAPLRMWTVRSDGTGNRPVYAETPDEWITHETFSGPDEVMFLTLGHLPYLRERPTGVSVVNLRDNQMKILGQMEEDTGRGRKGGFWHCNGSPDGRWAVADSFLGNVVVIDRHNGEQILLSTDHKMRPDHAHPIFSPDGRRVLIQSGRLSDGENLNLMEFALPDELLARQVAAEPAGEWRQLFNGKDIDDWIVKINHHEVGDNFGDTFRVEDGILEVRYDKYGDFNEQFGHLYYKEPFSHYHLAVEYRFVGDLYDSAPGYARLNSGVMYHAQDPHKILKDQNWPIALELQFLAGLGDGRPRATCNLCTPGTHVVYNGELDTRHIIPSSADTYAPSDWVRAEVIVRGNGKITHLVNGREVLEYSRPEIGGGVVAGHDPAEFVEGKPLASGYIGLQAEGQGVDFRKVEIKPLPEED